MNTLNRTLKKKDVVLIKPQVLRKGYEDPSQRAFVIMGGGGMNPELRDERLRGHWLDDETRRPTIEYGSDVDPMTEEMHNELGRRPTLEKVKEWEKGLTKQYV